MELATVRSYMAEIAHVDNGNPIDPDHVLPIPDQSLSKPAKRCM